MQTVTSDPFLVAKSNLFICVLLFFFVCVFIGIIGGTPVKRISEGLFCPLCFFVVGFYRHYRGDP